MIISHSKKFCMFLPWKTASQTMVARFSGYNESPYSAFFGFNPILNRIVHQHITCADFACLPESKMGYLIGSFVRNPYDRVYSGFRQLQEDIRTQPSYSYAAEWIRTLVMKQLDENNRQLQSANLDFDDWLASVREEQIYEIGHNTNFPLHPAHYWTHIDRTQLANFIGRVESFERDFTDFCSRIGIVTEARNANVVDLEGTASDNQFGYRYASRMKKKSIDKINSLFFRDFELFGYDRITG